VVARGRIQGRNRVVAEPLRLRAARARRDAPRGDVPARQPATALGARRSLALRERARGTGGTAPRSAPLRRRIRATHAPRHTRASRGTRAGGRGYRGGGNG